MTSLFRRMVNRETKKQKHSACERKVPYQTEKDAWAAIQQLLLDQNLDVTISHHTPYKCPYCRYWHYTSKGGR